VAVGDFNGDGLLDLAVADYGSNSVSVLLGNGDGSFQVPLNFAAGSKPASVAVGDFNGDGQLDLAVANYVFGGSVSVLLGNGDGTFQAPLNFDAGNHPKSVAVGDFNGDGLLDLAVANYGSSNVSVLLGNGDGTFQPARNVAVGPRATAVAVGDFVGDGVLDLAVLSGTVRVLLGNGDGTFQTTPVSYVAGSSPMSVAVGDFNGDSSLDLAVANYDSNDVSILVNDDAWPSIPRRPGGGHSPQTAVAAAPDRFVAAASSPVVSAPAALPMLPETLARQSEAPMLSASDEVRTEKPALPASPALHASPQRASARLLDGLYADQQRDWLWDRSADIEESGGGFGLLA
jgi:hypothetical protein